MNLTFGNSHDRIVVGDNNPGVQTRQAVDLTSQQPRLQQCVRDMSGSAPYSTVSKSSFVEIDAAVHQKEEGCQPVVQQPQPKQLQSSRSSTISKPELDWTFLKRGQLYGRDKEVQQLQQAFERRISDSKKAPELCLVAGKSGTGKSVLVKRALSELVEDHEGIFVLGKFDQLQNPEPYAPFVVALTQLVVILQQRYVQTKGGLRQHFLDQVGLESCYVLCSLVPVLGQVLGLHQEQTSFFALSAQQGRLKVSLKKMFQVICSKDTPLVLVMDDLQWADTGSLHLLENLISEESLVEGLMVVGICRDNEVPWHHSFAAMLRRLEDDKGAKIVHMQIKNLTLQVANELVSDVLSQPPQMCFPLTEIIHTKTDGNVFFILHYLKTLNQEGVLVAERRIQPGGDGKCTQFQWLWNDDQWDGGFHSLDVVDLVAFQIKRLPVECQQLLKTASCLGAELDVSMLNLLLNGDTDATLSDGVDVMRALNIMVEEQLVVKQMHRPGKFAFAHDRIQQASFALVPEEERTMSHVTIGRALYEGLSPKELEENLFLVVNQMILGIPLLTSELDKNGLASLVLDAGIKASRASDFDTALTYFQTGTDLLGRRHWRDEYHLSLNLFNSLAEAEASCERFETMAMTLREVLANCRSPSDEIRPHLTRIRALNAQLRFTEALDGGMQVLSSLRERLPSKPSVLCELVKVKRRLKGKTDEDLLNLARIDNKSKMSAIHVLINIQISAFCGNTDYFPFIVLRQVKLTLKYGINDASGIAFASYGMILTALGEYDEAYRFGQLSLRLLAQNESARAQWYPRVCFFVQGAINPWTKPIRTDLEALPATIAASMDNCDFENAVYSAYTYCINGYISGERIPVLEDRLEEHLEFIRHFKQGPWLALSLLARRFFLNLMGKTDEPLLLDFQSDEHEEGRDYLCPTNNDKFSFQLQESTLVAHRMVLAYHLGDLDLALACRKAVRAFEKVCKSAIFITIHYFYDGMATLEAAHCGRKRKRMAWGRAMVKKLEKPAAHQKHFLPMVSLLQAELEFLKKNLKKAMEWYEKAIHQATEEGARQFLALAYERAAIAQQRLGSAAEAKDMMEQAIDQYDSWGAVAISAHLRKKHNL